MSILLQNATWIDPNSLEFVKTDIFVNEGIDASIEFLGTEYKPLSKNPLKIIDCTGKLVTKSFAVGHHHAYSALAKGMPAPKKQPVNFYEILQYVWWTLDKCLDHETVELSALVTAMACAKSGSTFVIDHHASPNYISGSLELMAKAFDKVGINHLLCYEITDRDGIDKARQGLDETDEYLKKHQGLVGLHASFTVGNETLKHAFRLIQKHNSGAHVHLAEDIYDQKHCEETYAKRVTHRYHEAGLLSSSKTILVHALHLSAQERNLISSGPCWIAQNAESNMNNNVGYFNGSSLGKNIMMGTDGLHSDMLQSAKAAFFVGQRYDNIDYPGAYSRFRNVHRYIRENGFSGDGDNNIVVLDYDTATEINQNNFWGHFIFGLRSNHVQHVISNGKIVVENRKLTFVNETEILKEAQIQAMHLWKRMQT